MCAGATASYTQNARPISTRTSTPRIGGLGPVDVFLTADYQALRRFTTELVGGDVVLTLGTIGFGGMWKNASVEATVERVWQTNAFGNAWVGEAALTVPFAY